MVIELGPKPASPSLDLLIRGLRKTFCLLTFCQAEVERSTLMERLVGLTDKGYSDLPS